MTSSTDGTPPPYGSDEPEPPIDSHPVSHRVSDRLEDALGDRAGTAGLVDMVREFGDIDRAIYAAVAEVPTPTLDDRLRRLSLIADHSMIWFGVAGVSALVGGKRGRQAAIDGAVAIGITAFIVNVPLKNILPRRRPDRELHGVLTDRHVPLPTSPSFPSGHSASAFAFANAFGGELPWVALPLRVAAAAVSWSRIHTGVHYPGDVVAGALVGGAVGEAVGAFRRRREGRRILG